MRANEKTDGTEGTAVVVLRVRLVHRIIAEVAGETEAAKTGTKTYNFGRIRTVAPQC